MCLKTLKYTTLCGILIKLEKSVELNDLMDTSLIKLTLLLQNVYNHSPFYYIKSFGCAQNFADGEKIGGFLEKAGYVLTDDIEQADLVIYNTCAIRENAEDKVFGYIGELKHLKEKKSDLIIGVCGCMAQEKIVAERIKETYKQVDIVFGPFSYTSLYEMLVFVLQDKKRIFCQPESGEALSYIYQKRIDKISANVPIMYGCNNFCTYCIVPYVRGREKSRPMNEVIEEVKSLVGSGYKEIVLLGQNVNSYSFGFPALLREINSIDGDFRVRFLSSHPKDASKELIDAICDCDKICTQLHLPVQCGNDRILSLMNRRYTVNDYMEIVDYARSKSPDFSLSTDIIVGFPGESYEEFCDTKQLLKKVGYDNVFSFVYSKREGTRAAEMEDPISTKEKGKWLREMILEQREVAVKSLSRFTGKTVRCLPMGYSENNKGYLTGKSDEGIIVEFVGSSENIGKFTLIKITNAMNWALLGEIVK